MGYTSVKVDFKSKGGPQRIVRKLQDTDRQRELAEDLCHILLDEVNKYVPESSGKLKRAGYKMKFGTTGISTLSQLSYISTKKVPYVLYQYNGIVYGKNMAAGIPSGGTKMRPLSVDKTIQHTGWLSSKGKGSKYPTNRSLGHPAKHEIPLKDGRTITITGYTKNKNAQHKWLEYVRHTSTIWYPLRQYMKDYTVQFYSQYIDKDITSRYKKK